MAVLGYLWQGGGLFINSGAANRVTSNIEFCMFFGDSYKEFGNISYNWGPSFHGSSLLYRNVYLAI